MEEDRITVSASALYVLLTALAGEPHLIRELLALAYNPLFPDNPITQLTKELNDYYANLPKEG